MKLRRAMLSGLIALALPLAFGGCDLVVRAGNDLATAGDTITRAARGTSGSSASPPVMTEGHSPGFSGSSAGDLEPGGNGGAALGTAPR